MEIVPLRVARLSLPDWHPEGPGPCEVRAHAIRSRDSVILVDTGVGTDHPLIDGLYHPDDADLVAILLSHGIERGEVAAIINTHLHFDHCGNNRLFPGVPIHVQRRELEAAKAEHYTIPEWVDYEGAHYVPVDGDAEIVDGVSVLLTPGHTPGHQCVRVETEDGFRLIVAQAAYTAHEFESASRGEIALPNTNSYDDEAYRSSLERLVALGASHAYFSHDEVVWVPSAPLPPIGV